MAETAEVKLELEDIQGGVLCPRPTPYASTFIGLRIDELGGDRGLMIAFVGGHPGRQFEFVQTQWVNDGVFFGARKDKDLIISSNECSANLFAGVFRGLQDLSSRGGGEYCFMPGRKALQWLAELET